MVLWLVNKMLSLNSSLSDRNRQEWINLTRGKLLKIREFPSENGLEDERSSNLAKGKNLREEDIFLLPISVEMDFKNYIRRKK